MAILLAMAARLLLPACGIESELFSFLRSCPLALTATNDQQRTADALASRRTELERRVAALQQDLALQQCTPTTSPLTLLPQTPEIPSEQWEKGDLAMLDGCWALDQVYRLRNRSSGALSEFRDWNVCFDAAGDGTQTMRSTNGVTCDGKMSGEFDANGNLLMRDPGNLSCSDSTFIYRREVTCALTADKTVLCSDVQPEIGTHSEDYRMRRN